MAATARGLIRPETLVRPLVRRLSAYVPGEQPRIPGLVKLNTNENPYPPSPRVLDAVRSAVDDRLRRYPPPTAQRLRERLAAWHGGVPDQIVVGNGSDELLALVVRAFVEPRPAGRPSRAALRRSMVQYLAPCYSLYPVLCDTHGAVRNPVPLRPDFGLPPVAELTAGKRWSADAALTLLTTPNAPSGRGYRLEELEAFVSAHRGVVVLDEAYVDFAEGHAMDLALRHPHVLVLRTFSKAYSLCFQRVGYAVGHPELIAAIDRMRDSYNVNGLGQVAALATLEDLGYYRANFRRLIATRERVAGQLVRLGFQVLPSQTNFLFVRPPTGTAEGWCQRLRERRVLVRWFADPAVSDHLRITVGSGEEMRRFLAAVRSIRRTK